MKNLFVQTAKYLIFKQLLWAGGVPRVLIFGYVISTSNNLTIKKRREKLFWKVSAL
jgi:hypothetical protein